MIYHHKIKSRKSKLPLILSGILILLIIGFHMLVPTVFTSVFSVIGVPLLRGENMVSSFASVALAPITSKTSLQNRNSELEAEIEALRTQRNQNQLLLEENAQLKELLGREPSVRKVLASVLAKPPFTAYDMLLIDVGANYDVQVGDIVLAHGTVPIGNVSEVHGTFSKVVLYSSPGEQMLVSIGDNIQAESYSLGSGNFVIKLPRETVVQEGDLITAPSSNAEVFGTVEKIEITETDPFKYIRFRLPVNISQLRFVEVERGVTL